LVRLERDYSFNDLHVCQPQVLNNYDKGRKIMSKARDTQKTVKKKAEKTLKEKRKEKKAKKAQKKT